MIVAQQGQKYLVYLQGGLRDYSSHSSLENGPRQETPASTRITPKAVRKMRSRAFEFFKIIQN
jgi:hypothetical protein